MLIRVMGDPHKMIDWEEDSFWFSRCDVAMCTGDFGFHIQGRERKEAINLLKEFSRFHVVTVLGNHDGVCHAASTVYRPGEVEPACQEELIEALGSYYVGYRFLDLENISIVGGRPFSNGNPGIHHAPWGHEKITVEESARLISKLIEQTRHHDVIILSHNGPKGCGDQRDSLFGRDWKNPPMDWGDEDLALALSHVPEGKHIVAVITGHMHDRLCGHGLRQRMAYFNNIPIINAAVVPRVVKKGVIQTRPFNAPIIETKIYQEHRHFLDLEIDDESKNVIEVRDFWARRGDRQGTGCSMTLYRC